MAHLNYTKWEAGAGIGGRNRDLLARLHRGFEGPFDAAEASGALHTALPRARRLLAYFAARGWLTRIARGHYVRVPLDAYDPTSWQEDPWVVATRVFRPCYVAGWSACAHWGLTDQVFRTVAVVTRRRVSATTRTIQATTYRLFVRRSRPIFGTQTVWRSGVRTAVSDPSRTLVDILDEPALGGGIQHVAEVLGRHLRGDSRDDALLVQYAERAGNRTVFKRLGYLIETLYPCEAEIIAACKARLSSGLSTLDPTVAAKGSISKRWRLRVNVRLRPDAEVE